MKNVKSMYNSWSGKEIIKSNTIQFVLLALFFTIALNKLGDKGLTYLLNSTQNQTLYIHNYSLGIVGLIFLIPASLFSVWTIKGLILFKKRFLPPPVLDKIKKVLSVMFVVFSFLLKVFKMLMKAIMYLGLFIIAIISSGGSTSGQGQTYRSSAPNWSPNYTNDRRKEKEKAEWEARQKQKDADYALKYADKQARYNANTTHFDNRLNRALLKQQEANEAAKKARNL